MGSLDDSLASVNIFSQGRNLVKSKAGDNSLNFHFSLLALFFFLRKSLNPLYMAQLVLFKSHSLIKSHLLLAVSVFYLL